MLRLVAAGTSWPGQDVETGTLPLYVPKLDPVIFRLLSCRDGRLWTFGSSKLKRLEVLECVPAAVILKLVLRVATPELDRVAIAESLAQRRKGHVVPPNRTEGES